MPNLEAFRAGDYHWVIKRTDGEDIFVYADDLQLVNNALVFMSFPRTADKTPEKVGEAKVMLIIPNGDWQHVYMASPLDRIPKAVEEWPAVIGEET